MADDQAAAMQILGIDKASVLGVSQGGMIAQYLAIDHPGMVEKLILAVTAPYAILKATYANASIDKAVADFTADWEAVYGKGAGLLNL